MSSVSQVLADYLQRKQQKNPSFSLRAVAVQSGISASHLSRILNGKKRPSLSTIFSLCQTLEIDDWGLNKIEQTLTDVPQIEETLLPEQSETILKDWKALAILELADLDRVKVKASQVPNLIDISKEDSESLIKELKSMGLLVENDDLLKKTTKNLRFPALSSRKMIRNYHKSAMEKAALVMDDARQSEYARRLVTSMCITVDSQKVAEVKKEIQAALNKFAVKLSEENTDSVYQMNFQLVPLTGASSTLKII